MNTAGSYHSPMKVVVPLAFLLFQPSPAPLIPSSSVTIPIVLPKQYRNVPLFRQANGTYIIHPSIKSVKGLAIYRNGLRMASGIDYDYVAGSGIITPKPGLMWISSDVLLSDFEI